MKNRYFLVIFSILCMFLFRNNVFAITNSINFPGFDNAHRYAVVNSNSNFGVDFSNQWYNHPKGKLIFSYAIKQTIDPADDPFPNFAYAINILYGNTYVGCDTGTYATFTEESNSVVVATATCTYEPGSNEGLRWVGFDFVQSNTSIQETQLYLGRITYISDDSGSIIDAIQDQDNQDIVNAVGATTSAINSASAQNHQDMQQSNSNTNDIKNNTKETNDLIKSDNTSGAESAADDLKNNTAFQDNTGLSAIISMPLTFINTISNSCSPISLTIPYMDYTFQIPCIQSVVNNYMPALVVVLKTVVNGLIIYWVMLDIFKIVKSAKNPEDDRIEVLDL